MSLFSGKPSTSFSFGSPAATASTTPAKPLFGSATQQPTSTNLFSNATTSTTGTLFGSNTASNNTGLFGSKPAATTSGGLFASTTTPQTGSLFGNTAGTSGGLFNTNSLNIGGAGLFGNKNTTGGFGTTTTSGGLFGSKPSGGGLFGSNIGNQQPQTRQKETISTILLNADALVRSLTCPELYGDDRDQIVAKLNQIAAALGVGNGFYKDGQSVIYSTDGPFHRFKSVGYNMISEFTEADGIVSLIIKAPITEMSTSAQKQALIDKLFQIIGGGPNFPVKIKSIKEIPDNQTEVNIYVINKASGTPAPSSSLASLLSEPSKKMQLEQQLKLDKIIARFAMDKYQKERFIKDAPAGFDAALWQQACRENPDPARLLPFPIRGFEQLLSRQKTQNTETEIAKRVIDNLVLRLRSLESHGEFASVKATQQRVTQKQLAHRLLRILCMQLIQQRFGHPIDAMEEDIKAALESLSARLNGPLQIKERLSELSAVVQDDNSELKEKIGKESQVNVSESDIQQLQKYLLRCQEGLESLSTIMPEVLDKKARSEALRLESLKRKRDDQRRQSELIKFSLNNPSAANKVVFKYSDDEEEDTFTKQCSSTNKHQVLDEDENEGHSEFSMPQSARRSAKRAKTETDLDDPRFKINERFIQSEDDKTNRYIIKVDEVEENVRPVKSSCDENNENGNHRRVTDGNFYEMDNTFADELRSKNTDSSGKSNFSFLAMMGRKGSEKSNPLPEKAYLEPSLSLPNLKPESQEDVKNTDEGILLQKNGGKPHSKFFLTGNESHVKSVVANFRLTQSIEKTVGLWSNYRDSIMKIYRRQRKEARKHLRERIVPKSSNYPLKKVKGRNST